VHGYKYAPYPATDKMEGSLLVLFLGPGFSTSLPGIFSANALVSNDVYRMIAASVMKERERVNILSKKLAIKRSFNYPEIL